MGGLTSMTSSSSSLCATSQTEADPAEEKVVPYIHSLLKQVTDGAADVSPVNSSQRVTINMRTFKEEWRRQLLVDYDHRTNMSICMLCFTTFKSYDGPRKNTYVKHAKRFHPAIEEYSQEERDMIINMYEKYHKYDVDMQKEVNKSFRTSNTGVGKKMSRIQDAAVASSSSGLNGIIKTCGDESSEHSDEPQSQSELVVVVDDNESGQGGSPCGPEEKVASLETTNNNTITSYPHIKGDSRSSSPSTCSASV